MSYSIHLKGPTCDTCGHDKSGGWQTDIPYLLGQQVMYALQRKDEIKDYADISIYVPSFRLLDGVKAELVAHIIRCTVYKVQSKYRFPLSEILGRCEANPEATFVVE